MNNKKIIFILLLIFSISGCGQSVYFKPVDGFSKQTNDKLQNFFKETQKETGRKIAVFDGDGTVFGQSPHYLADECLYAVAKANPLKKPEVINRMKKTSNVSIPYVQDRIHFFEGDTVEYLRDLGDDCYKKYYAGKIYPQMKDLINLLKKNGFEIWIITASPEAMYQKFLARELAIPITNIVGIKSVVSGGKITSEIIRPVAQDKGKKEAIETFVQDIPLLAAGNSRGDKEMIEFSRGIRMIINPDEFTAPDQTESVASYARRNGWLVERITDIPSENFPLVSSKHYGIKTNKSNK